MPDYATWFGSATGRPAYAWQRAFGERSDCVDRLVRIPTGYGKTLGVLGAWLYHRVICADNGWPRRLIWTLPMRVLVEQTEEEARRLLDKLGLLWRPDDRHEGRVGVHSLMGGCDAGEWHLHPEEHAVLVGTQDMLLSRALNRGFGAARARWPMELGLVSHDALWVLDEVQLMDVGLATAAQLAAFRLQDAAKGARPAFTWAMSATLQRGWLTKSPDTRDWVQGLADVSLGAADRTTTLWAEATKPIIREKPLTPKELAGRVVGRHRELTSPAPLTLVVINTVDRAKQTYQEIRKLATDGIDLRLLHSRFRGRERAAWKTDILGPGAPGRSRIVVATQVIEAGVDLSADLLFTEICPWASLVQRLGRLARRGGAGNAIVLELDLGRSSAPYDAEDLEAAWDATGRLADGAPRSFEDFEAQNPELLPGLYPYEPAQILLREELDELFDTTPDLTGADLDVSRYIRSGDERDLSVFWIATPEKHDGRVVDPDRELRPVREGLCAVPFLAARDWLCGPRKGQSEPRKLRDGMNAWVWDYLDGQWRRAERKDLWPGQTVVVDTAVGGYDPVLGWDPTSKAPVPLVTAARADAQELADAAQDQEDLSATSSSWQTIGFHGAAVAREVRTITHDLVPPQLARLLALAARWHDLGKAHPAFQGAIEAPSRPSRRDLAKAPKSAWRRGRRMYRMSETEFRAGFRHELASALALFDVLVRHAPPEHPSRLGATLMAICPDAPAASSRSSPQRLELEILALEPDEFDLVAYLVCSHHGKVRTRLHAAPADQSAAVQAGDMPIRGVREGDVLPGTALTDDQGQMGDLPSSGLHLDPAALGLSPLTGRSWSERVDGLVARHGPFSLAWLEAILRAADIRASRDASLVDPAIATKEGT